MTGQHPRDELAAAIERAIYDWARKYALLWLPDGDVLWAGINHSLVKLGHNFPTWRARWRREIEGGE
jgi:hypothetical protein